LIQQILLNAGADSIHFASNGQEAIRSMRSVRPSLIISDWLMEPVDGLSFLCAVRDGKTSAPADTCVIMITKETRAHRIGGAIRAGADHYLTKPFTDQALLRAVRSALFSYQS
jgi:CheY-like chemotaxis protein